MDENNNISENINISEDVTGEVSEDVTGEASDKASEDVTGEVSDKASDDVIEEASEKAPVKDPVKRHKYWFWLRLAVFVMIALIVLTYFMYVFTPKYPYGICSLYNYYGTDKSTIDVLAVGTSLTYTDLNTNVLWNEYGIASYDLATAEQPYWSTYYYLKEALKTLDPKVVLLDLKAITYLDDKVDRTRTVLCSFGLLNPVSRLKCIYECVEPEEFMSYALAFPQIHTNFVAFKWSDMKIPTSNGDRGSSWKGYIEKNERAEHDAPAINFSFATAKYVNEHESEYFEKILRLCVDKGVTVMLIGYPNADYKHDHLYYCSAFEIAEKYGITGINYNLPENATGIDYAWDCADWQHLNVGGSVKFTRAVGADLKELFDLEDHRGDPAYASYDECAEKWFALYPQHMYRTY